MTNEVTAAQSLQWAYKEDEAALLIYVHAMNAALQETLKARQEAAQHLEDTRDDWALKLQARHKEVLLLCAMKSMQMCKNWRPSGACVPGICLTKESFGTLSMFCSPHSHV